MSQKLSPAIAVIGIDIGKNSFHVVGLDRRGAIVLRQKWSRDQVATRLANMPRCLIGMEACVGAHHLSRKLISLEPRCSTDAKDLRCRAAAKASSSSPPESPRGRNGARSAISLGYARQRRAINRRWCLGNVRFASVTGSLQFDKLFRKVPGRAHRAQRLSPCLLGCPCGQGGAKPRRHLGMRFTQRRMLS